VAPGALATIYQAGTLTTQAVYSDEAATITAANPIVADANGFWPQRYVNSPAKAVVTDSASAALYTLDPVPVSSSSSSAASAVSFTPTVALPFNNVQAAVEGAAAASAAGFAAFGIGITGNATLLADLDATGTGAGVYRFDGATTGTFPSGILASDTGLVSIWRQASNTAMMEISAPSMGTRIFRRRLSGGVWAAWREQVIIDQGATDGDTIYRTGGSWTRLAKGTAGQALRMNAGATAPEWGAMPFSGPVATTSGATVDISTAIPAGVRRITVAFRRVARSANTNFGIQVGAGSFLTTGYSSVAWGANTSLVSDTTSWLAGGNMGTPAYDGTAELVHMGSNNWVISGVGGANTPQVFSGTLAVGGSLDRLRLSVSSGTFNGGEAAIMWQF